MDEQPNDGIRFFQQALIWLGAVGAALLIVWLAVATVFSLQPEKMPVAVHQPPFESRQALARLTNPIGCDITIERPGRRPGCSWKREAK